MLKLTLDSLVVTSYEPMPADGGEVLGPNSRGCPEPIPSQYVGCPTYDCSAQVNCGTGGGYAC